jgi:hypothetical protein
MLNKRQLLQSGSALLGGAALPGAAWAPAT